jgi:hypothetical protein
MAGNLSGLLPASQLSGKVSFEQLPAAVLTNNQANVILSGTFVGSGAGLTDIAPRFTNALTFYIDVNGRPSNSGLTAMDPLDSIGTLLTRNYFGTSDSEMVRLVFGAGTYYTPQNQALVLSNNILDIGSATLSDRLDSWAIPHPYINAVVQVDGPCQIRGGTIITRTTNGYSGAVGVTTNAYGDIRIHGVKMRGITDCVYGGSKAPYRHFPIYLDERDCDLVSAWDCNQFATTGVTNSATNSTFTFIGNRMLADASQFPSQTAPDTRAAGILVGFGKVTAIGNSIIVKNAKSYNIGIGLYGTVSEFLQDGNFISVGSTNPGALVRKIYATNLDASAFTIGNSELSGDTRISVLTTDANQIFMTPCGAFSTAMTFVRDTGKPMPCFTNGATIISNAQSIWWIVKLAGPGTGVKYTNQNVLSAMSPWVSAGAAGPPPQTWYVSHMESKRLLTESFTGDVSLSGSLVVAGPVSIGEPASEPSHAIRFQEFNFAVTGIQAMVAASAMNNSFVDPQGWPAKASVAGGFALVNSNGIPFFLLSSPGSTAWTATNRADRP